MHSRSTLGAALAGALAIAFVGPAVAAEITACVSDRNGSLYNTAIGSAPSAPCKGGDAQLTWNTAGAAGADGLQGPTGPAGPPGSGAIEYELVLTTGTYEGGQINSGATGDCQNLGGRMATSRDILSLPWNASETVLAGWVQPHIVAAYYDGVDDIIVDISGVLAVPKVNGGMTCQNIGGAPWVHSTSPYLGLFALGDTAKLATCGWVKAAVCVVPAAAP
jgi:hypothetical protein